MAGGENSCPPQGESQLVELKWNLPAGFNSAGIDSKRRSGFDRCSNTFEKFLPTKPRMLNRKNFKRWQRCLDDNFELAVNGPGLERSQATFDASPRIVIEHADGDQRGSWARITTFLLRLFAPPPLASRTLWAGPGSSGRSW